MLKWGGVMTTGLGGYMGNVLYIDLTHRTTKKYPWSDQDRQLYLGGKIMAAKIIFDNIKKLMPFPQ